MPDMTRYSSQFTALAQRISPLCNVPDLSYCLKHHSRDLEVLEQNYPPLLGKCENEVKKVVVMNSKMSSHQLCVAGGSKAQTSSINV